MRTSGRWFVLSSTLLLAACGQKITVVECDGHMDGSVQADGGGADTGRIDTGTPGDTGVMQDVGPRDAGPDTGLTDSGPMNDSGPEDGGDPDGGAMDCQGLAFCIDDLVPDLEIANVGQPITFTPILRGSGLTFSVDAQEIVGATRSGLPDPRLDLVQLSLSADANGAVTLLVNQVPTFFAATTLTVTLHAQEGGAGPEVTRSADVLIRGNILYSGTNAVFAYDSSGKPAQSVNSTSGRFIYGSSFIDNPNDMILSRTGELLVQDMDVTPPRIRRFALDGENSHIGDFQFDDGGPIIEQSNDGQGMTQLADGRVAIIDEEFGRTPESRVHLFNESGTYDRSLDSPPGIRWSGVAPSPNGNLYVLERESSGRLVELNPDTGVEIGVLTTDISFGYNIVMISNFVYVADGNVILRVTPQGGKQMVSGLPSSSITYGYLAPYAEGRLLAARASSTLANILIIDGLQYDADARTTASNVSTSPTGIVYLE